ncbi:MAG: 2-oxoacid:acceptor oxidoreductase subunit alpha [Chloroflexi bacterium]|nr:2-oxoacid:acceptor oxidoreductase subunit alpha [Chloroflexota bacterium]MCH9038325.1 2-oxoacid:acceptor oxidoreductase subunit alpha [Chloroflexota bacterium]MCI0790977.1 2-oxoacid:acceptor oxidoreductase subunit alpha [Chloroflexota bacterium]MCI0796057.1 2-oxoacid:acceptor oxidoreductase subunit alpha [Chloroflexota bacterium]MCI0822177.1 2-oxoacid:acceptor oxidoreductase subunit alpha [Chloroflexota bacterium]
MQKNDFVVRFAGEGGQGMVTSSEGLAQAASSVGYNVQTFVTFPSQIMGGPTWAQARISTSPVLSSGDSLDVLVAFNEEAYLAHRDEVSDGGVIIFNEGAFEPEAGGNSFGMRFSELAKQTGNARAENMIVLGALAYLVGMPMQILEDFVRERFTRGRANDEEIISSNIQALGLGHEEAEKSGFTLGELAPPQRPEGEQILINGNEAVSVGAVAAGVNFYVGYPISPATSILLWMERNLTGEGKFVYQASSEIEAINAVFGGGYAGRKAMSATAGPGLSLMGEGLGLAWMAEVPLVIVNVQRGGPSTGLPTKTEQSDLLMAMTPGHGDISMPIIAPGTVEECFYGAVMAFNWAERYQGPVILLSEHMLSERKQNIPKPDLSKLKIEDRLLYTGSNGYNRYDGWELSPMSVPGSPGSYIANGSEHDGMGDTTHLGERHIQMTERRFSKLKLLENESYERENTDASIVIMPWGGSKGPASAAYEQLQADGADLGWYYTMFLNPLPKKMLEELKQKALVIVPELNYLGQLSGILRSQGVKAVSITQYTGLPFKVADLAGRISDRVAEEEREGVTV